MDGDGSELLDRIFQTPDEDVETFADVIKKEAETSPAGSFDKDFLAKAAKGEQVGIEKTYRPKEQVQGFIRIISGWLGADFVWHIGPAHPKKPWKVSLDRVIFAMVHTLNKYLPKEQRVDIFPPYQDWEIPEVTLKAIGIKNEWWVDEKELEKLNLEFMKVLNPLLR